MARIYALESGDWVADLIIEDGDSCGDRAQREGSLIWGGWARLEKDREWFETKWVGIRVELNGSHGAGGILIVYFMSFWDIKAPQTSDTLLSGNAEHGSRRAVSSSERLPDSREILVNSGGSILVESFAFSP